MKYKKMYKIPICIHMFVAEKHGKITKITYMSIIVCGGIRIKLQVQIVKGRM